MARSQRSRHYAAPTRSFANSPVLPVMRPPNSSRARYSTPSRASTRCCPRPVTTEQICSMPGPGPAPGRDPIPSYWNAPGLYKARSLILTGASPRLLESGQETVTAVRRRADDFVYTITRHGDGTVPAISAALPGAPTHYAPVAHGDLTRDRVVAAAVVDLLRKGSTRRLPSKWVTTSRAEARITDRELRRTHVQKVDWAALEPDERRIFLQTLNEPPKLQLRVPRPSGDRAVTERPARKSPAGVSEGIPSRGKRKNPQQGPPKATKKASRGKRGPR